MFSYKLSVDEGQIAQTCSRYFIEKATIRANMQLPDVMADIGGVLGQLGYQFRADLDGNLKTNKPLDDQAQTGIQYVAEQAGVPVKVQRV